MSECIPTVIFGVPRGFEDVCMADILRFLPIHRSTLTLRCPVDSGFVFVKVANPSDLRRLVQVYDSGELWCVTRCMIALVEDNYKLGKELCNDIERERRSLPSKKSRNKAKSLDDASKQPKNDLRPHTAPFSDGDPSTTPSEGILMAKFVALLKQDKPRIREVLNLWWHLPCRNRKAMESLSDLAPQSFAFHFERREFIFPTYRNQDVSRILGECTGSLVLELAGMPDIDVDLSKPELDVVGELFWHIDDEKWHFIAGIQLSPPHQLPQHRANRSSGGRTPLLAARAYALCLLHPLISSKVPAVIMDPCSGTGSIPIELAAIAERFNRYLVPVAADNELPSLAHGLVNSKLGNVDMSRGLRGVDAPIFWDGHGRGVSGGLRQGCLDGVITDLPWGQRELSTRAVVKLYPLLLETLGHAIVDGGIGVFMLWREKTFLAAISGKGNMWEVLFKRPVNVEGMLVFVYTLRRRPRNLSEQAGCLSGQA